MASPGESLLHKAILYERLPANKARCGVCQRRCVISDGEMGACVTRLNKCGDVYSTIYGVVSSMAADPIEKKPLYHYLPGTKSFSLGSFGCNFRCAFCQNWQIAYADGGKLSVTEQEVISPERAVELALRQGCASISWTYNEPAIWLEYTLDCAVLARTRGLHTVYVTNGYITPEGLDIIGPHLDAYRVDIKSSSDEFYRKLIGIPSARGVLDVAKQAKDKWKMHVEAVTNVIPGWNDDSENLRAIAHWIKNDLGELTPWHVTRFFPSAKMMDVPPTPPGTLERARQIGAEEGLKFVYLGNIASDEGRDTLCPSCGSLAISRLGFSADILAVTDCGMCAKCGADMNVVMKG